MAYRSSHYRKGHYRRTPSGGYTWVSATYVSAYNYTPGISSSKSYFNYMHHYNENEHEIRVMEFDDITKDLMTKVADAFKEFNSLERKYCLDMLDAIDTDLDSGCDSEVDKCLETDQSIRYDIFEYEKNHYEEGYCIKKYVGFNDEVIIIPDEWKGEKITKIASGVFKHCYSLKKVSLGKNIKSIESFAFQSCSNLKEIRNTHNLTYIGERSFCNCSSLSEFSFNNNLLHIGEYSFKGTNLGFFKMPTKIKFLARGTFHECKQLKTVILNNEIIAIGDSCFFNCDALTNIEIPKSVQEIGNYAFFRCNNLKEAIIYASNTKWGDNTIPYETKVFCYPGSTAQEKFRDRCLKLNNEHKGIDTSPNEIFKVIGYNFNVEPKNNEIDVLINYIKYKCNCDYVVELNDSPFGGCKITILGKLTECISEDYFSELIKIADGNQYLSDIVYRNLQDRRIRVIDLI